MERFPRQYLLLPCITMMFPNKRQRLGESRCGTLDNLLRLVGPPQLHLSGSQGRLAPDPNFCCFQQRVCQYFLAKRAWRQSSDEPDQQSSIVFVDQPFLREEKSISNATRFSRHHFGRNSLLGWLPKVQSLSGSRRLAPFHQISALLGSFLLLPPLPRTTF